MKGEDLLDAVGGIEPKYVDEAEKIKKPVKRRKPIWKIALPAAACLAVVVVSVIALKNRNMMDDKPSETVAGVEPTTVQEDETPKAADDLETTAAAQEHTPVEGRDVVPDGSEQYAVYEVSGADGIEGAHHNEEVPEWSSQAWQTFVSEDAAAELTVQICGEEFTGTYQYSQTRPFVNYQMDVYAAGNASFTVRPDIGQVVAFSRPAVAGDLTKQECIDIANRAAHEYIVLKDYDQDINDHVEDDAPWINKRLYRSILGVELRSWFSVNVSTSGEVCMITAVMIPEGEDFYAAHSNNEILQMGEDLLSEQNKFLVFAKLDEIYKDVRWQYGNTEFTDQYFALNAKGELCLVYVVNVSFKGGPSEQIEVAVMPN